MKINLMNLRAVEKFVRFEISGKWVVRRQLVRGSTYYRSEQRHKYWFHNFISREK